MNRLARPEQLIEIEFDAVDIFDLRDEKLWKMKSFFDIESIRKQMGQG